jgi:type III secretion system YscQ/HrcQ family protein
MSMRSALSSATAAPVSTAAALLGDDAVEMMVRVTRHDVTVYVRASALPELWLQLLACMQSMARVPARSPSPDDDDLTVSVAVAVASGRIAANLLNRLRVGDVVRLGTSFETNGLGRLKFGDIELDVQWRARSPQNVFEVRGRSFSPTIKAASRGPSESSSMNPDYPDATGDEGAANGLLDEVQEAYRWSSDADSDVDEHAVSAVNAETATSDPSALENLPVTVVAEIGTLTITLGQLRAMQPGMLIKLGARGGDDVVLRAVDGPPLAYAELVDIGGHIGMQVTRIAAP